AVGLCPQPDPSSIAESRIFDLEQLNAVVGHPEAGAFEVDPEAVPAIGWDRDGNSVTSLTPNNVKRTADAVDGLVEHDVVFESVGADHVVIVRICGPPNKAGRAVFGTGNGLELNLDEAVLDVGVVLEKQRVGRATGLFKYLQSRRCRLVLFDCPFRIALAGPGHCPAFGRGANRI